MNSVCSGSASARMRNTKGRDNRREVSVRSLLYRAGVRFRLFYPVPGAPRRSVDIALVGPKVAIFLDGCFWHGCPIHRTTPKRNREWWVSKLERNVARDKETTALLQSQGWAVLRFWEHEPVEQVVTTIIDVWTNQKSR